MPDVNPFADASTHTDGTTLSPLAGRIPETTPEEDAFVEELLARETGDAPAPDGVQREDAKEKSPKRSEDTDVPDDLKLESEDTSEIEVEPKAEVKPKATEAKPAPKAEEAKKEEPAKKPRSFLDELAGKPAEEAKKTEPEDPFDKVKLRSDASPKTKETFDELKRISRERMDALKKEQDDLRAELAKVKATPSDKLPDAVEKELKELRELRAQFYTERDPEFAKKFDAKRESALNTVYQTLTEFKLPEAELAKLKGMSEDERIANVERLAAKLPPKAALRLRTKMAEAVAVDEERANALAEARANAEALLKNRAQEPENAKKERITKAAQAAQKFAVEADDNDFLFKSDVPAGAAPEVAAKINEANAKAERYQGILREVLLSEDPEVHAKAAVGLVFALAQREQLAGAKARIAELEKQLSGIKKASSTSARGTVSTPAVSTPRQASVDESIDDAFAAFVAEQG